MKKHRKIFYCCGYALAAAALAVIMFADLPKAVDLALAVLFSILFSVSHVQLLHDKMMKKDQDYQVGVMDERNIAIKEKTGNITCMILTLLLGLATVVFIGLDLLVPAVITGGIVAVQPVIMIVVSTVLEKRM
ncbi:MAG TPA: hypothetical protein IAB39_08540 [Candidatus Onthovicinus excrementipullorum]|nr:hypothetical protein [Candidatus Onthovicinus excrementipullorum]